MSLGYADRLKQRKNLGGQLGAQEYHQSFEDIKAGIQTLAQWIKDTDKVFIFTGAGISTSCGIPDFRGPNGIWTLRKKKLPIPSDFTPFEYAKPSFTHMVIAALVLSGKAPYVCSQNVDGLHLRSGVPRQQLAELHGNCFAERCTACRTEYSRDFQMETVNFRQTGRVCPAPGCGAPLVDNILDWDTALPEDELEAAVEAAEGAGVALVLGTSLQIQPANEIPVLTHDEGGKMVIVNLQKTPKDRRADLLLRCRVDLAMALLAGELGLQVPPYVRSESLLVEHRLSPGPSPGPGSAAAGPSGAQGGRALTVTLRSVHGRECPVPILESVVAEVEAAEAEAGPARVKVEGEGDGEGEAAIKAEADHLAGIKMEPGTAGSGAADRSGSGGAASSSGRGPDPAAPWRPAAVGPLTGSPGAYVATFPGLPYGLRAARVTLRLRLVRWADADKRDVTLSHVVDLAALGAAQAAAAEAQGRAGAMAGAKGEAKVREATPAAANGDAMAADGAAGAQSLGPEPGTSAAGAPAPAGPPPPPGFLPVTHRFVSQEAKYDPEAVVAAFLAAPPPVVVPEPPAKKAKKEPSPAPAPTRQSQRLSRNSQRAAAGAAEAAGAAAEAGVDGASGSGSDG
ncbi:hypothetical protein HYH03_010049 [Edaphochlamys debaryana]|uniref:protein acetyllysine N-acetyltransferase n=1 Tax=Edaphochlamys debaryana TaxID=47281 RepID=A0A836BWG1_9CHLO|nr:hypothetical protein HYH03_010049 [Edaphochlamys debaryana]|eukprot:KAG2491681.1 hypothetical protein HYH03_010049 [Edaphochlamys debaryana]